MSPANVSAAGRALEQIVVSLRSLQDRLRHDPPGATADVDRELGAALATLQTISRPIAASAVSDRRTTDLAIRADENLTLAGLSLQGTPPEESRTAQLLDAVFHTIRAVTQLQECEATTIEVTRDIDRTRNDQEFLSG